MPWKRMARLIKPYYYNKTTDRPPYDLITMVKIHCLQQWYNLSDLGMEEAIYDRLSFQRFLNIDLMSERIPDETTILNFRHLLERCDLTKQILKLINRHLEEKGLMMKAGTIVDATIISSASSTKNKERKRDPEMSSTKKNNQWYFGMKSHIGTDAKSEFVHTCEVSPANTSDVELTIDLLHGEEKAIFGDRGYVSKEDKTWARSQGIFWGVPDRKAPSGSLSQSQQRRNKRTSSIRAKVEHPFRVIKHLWGHRKTRYKGLEKNGSQLNMLYGLCNLYMARMYRKFKRAYSQYLLSHPSACEIKLY